MDQPTDQELLALLNQGENERVEFKESFKGESPKKIREAVCTFANDLPQHNQPGIVFIGVKDNGEPSHTPITDELLLNLADIKTDARILPSPALTVQKRLLKGAEIAVICVAPSDMPPVKNLMGAFG